LKAEFGDVCDTENWYHFAIVQDGSVDKAYMYQNGDLKATVTSVGEIDVVDPESHAAKIGRKFNHPSSYFNGKIDEFGIWNVALTTIAIQKLYNGGKPIRLDTNSGAYTSSDELEGWWRMGDGIEDGSGSTIYDMSTNRVNGEQSTLAETPAYSTEVP
jgi:hypothetical protein